MSISSHETPLYTSYKRNASGIFDFFCAKDNVFYFIQFTAPLARRFLPRFPGPLDTPHSACPLFDLDLIPSSGAGFRKFFPCFMTVYSTIPPSFCSNKMPLRNACYESVAEGHYRLCLSINPIFLFTCTASLQKRCIHRNFLHQLQNREEQNALRHKEYRRFNKAGLNQQVEGFPVHHR